MGTSEVIAIAGLIITLGGMVWRMSALATRVNKNEETAKSAHTRLDKYTERHDSIIDEMKQQITTLVQVQVRIEEKINYLIDGKLK